MAYKFSSVLLSCSSTAMPIIAHRVPLKLEGDFAGQEWRNLHEGTSLRCICPCSQVSISFYPCQFLVPLSTFPSHSPSPCCSVCNKTSCMQSSDLNMLWLLHSVGELQHTLISYNNLAIFMELWTVTFNPSFNFLFSLGFYIVSLYSVCLNIYCSAYVV